MLRDLGRSFNWLCSLLPSSPPAAPQRPPDVPCPLTHPHLPLPPWVSSDPLVCKYRALLSDLPWAEFPQRSNERAWPGPAPDPRAPFVAAFLIKLHEGKRFMSQLRAFLIEHPALVYWLGFERILDPTAPFGFDVAQTVPKRRHFSTVLRTLPNDAVQFLLCASIHLLQSGLSPDEQASFGDCIAGDTQALLAWVKENNPKQYIKEGRLDKNQQPKADPDCKLSVKRRTNAAPQDADDDPPAPTTEATPTSHIKVGENILWGYASGIVVTRLRDGNEIVLAERTRPFNESDPSHFKPLMAQVEARLGRRPRFGTWDCAFDAHYVYEYFDVAGGFAAVPFNSGKRGGRRTFAADGAPLCAAGLPMVHLLSYVDRTSGLEPHQREKWGCPLLKPTATGEVCPTADPHWPNGGCTTTIAAGSGSRIRHELDREGEDYKRLYAMRTMVERINSQAEALGIVRPKLRRGRAIANQNTLTYVLINLRALARRRAAATEVQPTTKS